MNFKACVRPERIGIGSGGIRSCALLFYVTLLTK